MPGRDDGQQRRIGGRYLLSALLGSGAMGTVWSGYDEVLQRRVAVKELKVPPGVPAHEARDMRERIMREARALGGLSHPNVITVFDVVVDDGAPVVVLEMVPSRDLATMISEHGALTMSQAAVIGFTTAGALRAAHRSGITHRDVKPGNVLVADDGRVKLTDFGIARNIADAPMTSAGLVLGSPAYIAPEVAAGQPVTTAADLWGLGATLFAAIEGRPPYDVHGDPVRTITEVVDGEVPRPRATGPVAEVIAALMVKDPDRRMTLDEVRFRLRPLIVDPDDPVYPGSPDAPTLASPITVRPTGGTPSGRRAAGPVHRPAAADAGPPSLVKTGQAGAPPRPAGTGRPTGSPGAGGQPRPGTGTGGDPRPGTGTGGHPRPGTGTGTGGDPRPGGGTGGHPRPGGGPGGPARPGAGISGQPWPGGPSESTPSTRSGAQAAVASTPLAAAPGPLPPGIRSPLGPAAPSPQGHSPLSATPLSATPPAATPPAASPLAALSAAAPAPAPLAAAPGPWPPRIASAATGIEARSPLDGRAATTGASGWVAVGLVIAGAAVVLAGIGAGWAITRTVAGQSPWTTVTVSTTGSR